MPHISHRRHAKVRKGETLLGKFALIVALVEPLMTLPQVYDVWIRRETSGVSLTTWSFFTFTAVVWFFYGIQIKNTPIVISSALWIVVEGSIVAGVLIY